MIKDFTCNIRNSLLTLNFMNFLLLLIFCNYNFTHKLTLNDRFLFDENLNDSNEFNLFSLS